MNNQKGFDNWIPIFRGGKQKDSNGIEHDGDALIDTAIAKFNAARHEPPIVIGHPKEDAPAWGWVEGLKKVGNELLMKCKQVQPEFAAMVERGQYKKRSAAFYPDGSLRHVGFLGAMPPAVKGLPDVAFAEPADASFEFSESWAWNNLADVFRNLREWLIAKEGQDTADKIVPDWKIEDMRSAANPPEEAQSNLYKEDTTMNLKEKAAAFFAELLAALPGDTTEGTRKPAALPAQPAAPAGQTFSEADIEKIRADAEAKGKQTAQAEFAETQRQTKLATIKSDITAFCEKLIKEGRITPATVAFGLPEILFSLAAIDNQIEFVESREKATAFDRLKAMLETAKPLVTFGEFATRDKDTGGTGKTAGDKLDALTRAKMKANTALTYSAAFAEVQKENLELAKEYTAEFQRE